MAILTLEERPMKRRRLNEDGGAAGDRFGLLNHLTAQIVRTPPNRCGPLYRRLLIALQQERADEVLSRQLSGLLLQSLEYVLTVRTEDDDSVDDFDELLIRLAHDITLCLRQVLAYSEGTYEDEAGLAMLSSLLQTLQLLQDTSPEIVLSILPQFPPRLFLLLEDSIQQKWVTCMVQHNANALLRSLSIERSAGADEDGNKNLTLYATVALDALEGTNQRSTLLDRSSQQEHRKLVKLFYWHCKLLQSRTEVPVSVNQLKEHLADPAFKHIAVQSLVLLSSPDRTNFPDRKQLIPALLSVFAKEDEELQLLHQGTTGLRNLLQEPDDYEQCLSAMALAMSTSNVLENLLRVSATSKDWETRDSTVWGTEILWSLISYLTATTTADDSDSDEEGLTTTNNSRETFIHAVDSQRVSVNGEDNESTSENAGEVDFVPVDDLSVSELIDIAIRGLHVVESDEYALYLATRTICNDQADWFLTQVSDHPKLMTALASALEDYEASDVVREAILEFFTTIVTCNHMSEFTLASQDGVLPALAAMDPSFLFLLSDSEDCHVLLTRTPRVIASMVHYAREQQESNNIEEYQRCRSRILELAQFL